MEPTLREGDYVLVWKTKKVKPNELIVFKHCDALVVKRVVNSGDEYLVDSDNHGTSFKPIKRENVVGKVVFKF